MEEKDTLKEEILSLISSTLEIDKNLEEIGRVGGIIVPLQPGQSTQFNSGTQSDYANAYDFKIVETQN